MSFRKLSGFQIALLILLLLGLATGCSRKNSRDRKGRTPKPLQIALLVDLTVENRAGLKEEFNRMKLRIFDQLDKNPGPLLGSRLDVIEIDDRGENSPVFRYTFPKVRGRAKIKLKVAVAEFNQKMEKFIGKLGKGKKVYKRSMYLEAISRGLKEYDEIHVLGDLALVDHERNFEIGKFKKVVDLTALAAKKKVELIRIPVPGQTYGQAEKIEVWWNRSIFGAVKAPHQKFAF